MAANNRKSKIYVLTDGTEVTAFDIVAKTGVSVSTARCRLARTRDPEKIFLIKSNDPKKGKFKSYTLDDGSVWTIPEIVAKAGISKQCAAARLHRSHEVALVLKTKSTNGTVIQQAKVTANMRERMYFDPDGFWKLFNKAM